MTYLELVNFAMSRAGARQEAASTLAGETGLVLDFSNWVADSWYDLQQSRTTPPWWWKMAEDQTLAISSGTDTYAVPAGLASLDWRSITIYTTAKTDETPVKWIDYQYWRTEFDTKTATDARPQYITTSRDGDDFMLFPVPEQAYTLRFDAETELNEMTLDADTPTGLPVEYHRYLAWDAVKRYGAHHGDQSAMVLGMDEARTIMDRMTQRQLPAITVEQGRLYCD